MKNLNLQVRDGEYLCIIGPSGCGKTTLIKCIAGIIKPDEGEIYVNNKLMNNIPIQDREIGYVFQEIALFPHMNVYDNICYSPLVKGWGISRMENIVKEMINMMKLQDRIKDYPDALSGGARQKTAIARALVSGSRILLLDEPLGSLDAKVRKILRYELRRITKDLNLTAIHVTHDQEEAMSIADRIAVMRGGEIVEVGTPLELYLYPKKLFTANFVGEANFLICNLMGQEGKYVKIDINGKILYGVPRVNLEHKRVVAVIRPEFILMKKTSKTRDSWKGVIERKTFLGSSIRFEIRTKDDSLLTVKKPAYEATKFKVGENVNLILPRESLLLYPYPREGLEKAISIE